MEVKPEMENRYPLFAGGRILKKEALWDLRDYAYESMRLAYMDYTDGIIKGCRVRVEGTELIIGKGLLKYRDYIYLLREEAKVPFRAENRMLALKAEFQEKRENPDYLVYRAEFFLDSDLKRQENQTELCRFHLREGSVLRDTYKNFSDMGTEYDTVNLLYATVAGRGRERLHPEVLLRFAEEMQGRDAKSVEDVAFCYHVLQNEGEVERKVTEAYLKSRQSEKTVWEGQHEENTRFFDMLDEILNCRGNGERDRRRNRVIVVE